MPEDRLAGLIPDPGEEPVDEREGMIPPVPKQKIRKMAHAPDAKDKVADDAVKNFRSCPRHRQREGTAKVHLAEGRRAKRSREKTLDKDLDKRERSPTTFSNRFINFRDIFTVSNIPTLAAVAGTALATLVMFGGEVGSGTLLMLNSGWGLTESIWLMIAITAVFSLQPFFGTKMLVAVLTCESAAKVQKAIALFGVPMSFVGFWALANTLGPMAEADEFAMVATDALSGVAEESPTGMLSTEALTETGVDPETGAKPLSKTTYLLVAMVSMWNGAYAAFFWFTHFLDQLFPVIASDREDYAWLSSRIDRSERELTECDKQIITAEQALATEKLLEDHYVELCVSYLEEAQEELEALKANVRLTPYTATPSPN